MPVRKKTANSSTSSISVPLASSPRSTHSAKTICSSSSRRASMADVSSPLYRQVRILPYELREQVTVYFEEGLYNQALNLLKCVLTSGNISTAKRPAILPPPHHLSLIATLAVHPSLTTRAKSLDRIQAANSAIQYLQTVVHHVGPAPGILGDAFTFVGKSAVSRRRGYKRRKTSGEGISPSSEYIETIDTELANTGSLWTQVEDFWQVIGWCFNCSVLHQRRWERWSAWLALMIEFLERDWEARHDDMHNSQIVRYINSGDALPGKERRIVRAVFSDGRTKAHAEFGEIWRNETRELKKDDTIKKAESKIDIEADDYGDYTEEENENEIEESALDFSPPLDTSVSSFMSVPDTSKDLGGVHSITLRIRLLSLLSKVSDKVPSAFTPITSLYQSFFEYIKPLPVPAFFAIVLPMSLQLFDPTAASSLTQYILRSIITAAAPLPPTDTLSQDIFQTSYLPFAANTNSIVDNTKVSLCVESLLRLLDLHCGLDWSPAFHDAAEAGIKARMTKAKAKQPKKSMDGDGVCDRSWLASSSERIRMVIKMARP